MPASAALVRPWRRRFKRGLCIAPLALAGLLLTLGACGGLPYTLHEADLFHPNQVVAQPPTDPKTTALRWPMADGTTLCGWRFTHPNADGSMLFILGNGDLTAWRMHTMARLAECLRLNVYVFDYRGYGASEGHAALHACADDAVAIFDRVVAESHGQPVGIFGYSIGTGFASRLAAKRPPRFLVLQAPPTSCEEVIAAWDRNIHWSVNWLIRLKPAPELLDPSMRPCDFVKTVQCPLLVIHGDADEVIPYVMGKRMFESAPAVHKEMLTIPGGKHCDLDLADPRVEAALGRMMGEVRGKGEVDVMSKH